MPSFQNLKKQAKLYLRWYREGYYPVAATIRASLPRFRRLSDPEVLSQDFKLADAQELVARQHGFESWLALKTGVQTMTQPAEHVPSKAFLSGAEPQLFVTDMQSACDFFSQNLGFSIAFVYGEPPFYAQVKRDGAVLNLRHVDTQVIDQDLRESEDLLSASITVNTADEIKQLYLEFQSSDVAFHQPLRREPWGARNFIVKDPDNNLLLFSGPAD